jgi:hypothetical protein
MPKRTVLTIAIVAGKVEVSSNVDNRAVKGGHVRARPGRRIRWERSTDNSVTDFDLAFESFEAVEGPVAQEDDWPFTAHDADPAAARVRPFKGTVIGATAFEGKLSADSGVYKYTVKARNNNQEFILDPVIIVEN